jgi:toxin YoeB
VVSWQIVFAKATLKDAKKLVASGLKPKAQVLLEVLVIDPVQDLPLYEKLVGDLAGAYPHRINIRNRIV